MPSSITVRYFEVRTPADSTTSFSDALSAIGDLKNLSARSRKVGHFSYRLDRYKKAGHLTECEIVKIQSDNLPGAVKTEGLDELDVEGLGYGISFVFDEAISVLAIQYDNKIVSLSKLGRYLVEMDAVNRFTFSAIEGDGMWGQFKSGTLKSFRMRVASPDQFDEESESELESSIFRMGEAYDSPYITVSLSVGNRKTRLSDLLKGVAGKFLNSYDIRSMKATTVECEGDINLMQHLLHDSNEVDIPNNPEKSYEARNKYVSESFQNRRPNICKVLGIKE